MIIFTGAGRLGNQLFQLYFLEGIRKPHETVLSVEMGQVIKYCDGFEKLHNTDSRSFATFFDRIIKPALKILGKLHIISTAIEMHNTGYHKETKGILPITYAFGFVQHDMYIKDCKNKDIRLKQEYIDEAKKQLEPYAGMKKIFIHVRHGDYPEDMKLPDAYYRKALEHLMEKDPEIKDNGLFVLLGDDQEWSRKMFGDLPHTYIPQNSLITDFAIMTQCDGGIISNSTFAWMGAYFCNCTLPVIAPKYWTDFKNRKWYPLCIKTERFNFIEWW